MGKAAFFFSFFSLLAAGLAQCMGVTWDLLPLDWQRGRFYRGFEQRFVQRHDDTNANDGDTPCFEQLPLACVGPTALIGEKWPPATYYSNLVAKGAFSASDPPGGIYRANTLDRELRLTHMAVSGDCFASAADMDAVCASEHGPGWRSVHHHMGRDINNGTTGWSVVAFMRPSNMTPPVVRVWTYVSDQLSNPWNSGASPDKCASSVSPHLAMRDECVTYGRPVCGNWRQQCVDADPLNAGGLVCGTCDDKLRNLDEEGVGCGGKCGNECNLGGSCDDSDPSCQPGCSSCPVSCSDGWENGLEAGVDCGEVCDTKACPTTCWDGIQNQLEEDVDCGGPFCVPCQGLGLVWRLDDVQQSGVPPVSPTCFDAIRNQGELGVDCGGPYCAPCSLIRISTRIPVLVETKTHSAPLTSVSKVGDNVSGITFIISNDGTIADEISRTTLPSLPMSAEQPVEIVVLYVVGGVVAGGLLAAVVVVLVWVRQSRRRRPHTQSGAAPSVAVALHHPHRDTSSRKVARGRSGPRESASSSKIRRSAHRSSRRSGHSGEPVYDQLCLRDQDYWVAPPPANLSHVYSVGSNPK